MNLILLTARDLAPDGSATLTDRRAEHLLQVLKVQVGSRVRVGVLNGPQGQGEVTSLDARCVTVRCTLTEPPPVGAGDTLLLGVARPKVLLRCLEHAAALGFARIVLFRSRRVEKSHLLSHALDPEVYTAHLCRGLEQARRTQLPELSLVPRFRQLLEQVVPSLPMANRFVADADAAEEAPLSEVTALPLCLVIGPEGGLIDHELERFAEQGFRAVHTGRQPLRVESALSYVTGQLRAARTLRAALAARERPAQS
jgi:16S rRNA (uracil1498-N3)-methyltransferase